jgi:phosphoribosylaminoimidazole carboxylase
MEGTKEVLHKALAVSGAAVHWYSKLDNKAGCKMAHVTVVAEDIAALLYRVEGSLGLTAAQHGLQAPGPAVGIVLDSDAELSVMQEAAGALRLFSVSCELTVISAHRTPTRMYSYAQSAAERGVQVIIASGGGSGHLGGMMASLTSLPVICVPFAAAACGAASQGQCAPVATVGVRDASNAGLLAVRILAARDAALRLAVDNYTMKQEEEVLRQAAKLEATLKF